jgi:hypothetical protein
MRVGSGEGAEAGGRVILSAGNSGAEGGSVLISTGSAAASAGVAGLTGSMALCTGGSNCAAQDAPDFSPGGTGGIRVSTGGSLARAAYGTLRASAAEMLAAMPA